MIDYYTITCRVPEPIPTTIIAICHRSPICFHHVTADWLIYFTDWFVLVFHFYKYLRNDLNSDIHLISFTFVFLNEILNVSLIFKIENKFTIALYWICFNENFEIYMNQSSIILKQNCDQICHRSLVINLSAIIQSAVINWLNSCMDWFRDYKCTVLKNMTFSSVSDWLY